MLPLNNPTFEYAFFEYAFLTRHYDENALGAVRDRVGISGLPPTLPRRQLSARACPVAHYRACAGRYGEHRLGTILGCLSLGGRAGSPTSPIFQSAESPIQHEVVSPVTCTIAGKPSAIGSRTLGSSTLVVVVRVEVGVRRRMQM